MDELVWDVGQQLSRRILLLMCVLLRPAFVCHAAINIIQANKFVP